MSHRTGRREFIRDLGFGAAALPFVLNLPSLGFRQSTAAQAEAGGDVQPERRRALGILARRGRPVVQAQGKPEAAGAISGSHVGPAWRLRQVRGDGDNHMRGIGCLLTGIELFPGNIQGGSDTPAGWAKGISIDQEIKNHLQSRSETRTRLWIARIRRDGARPCGHLDAHGLRRRRTSRLRRSTIPTRCSPSSTAA